MTHRSVHRSPRTALAVLCTAAMAGAGLASVAPAYAAGTPRPFVSELHYDNDGSDVGEFIEVQVPDGTSAEGWTIVRYNGNSGGVVYDTPGTDPTFAAGAGVQVADYPSNGLQNGAPDGFALVDDTGRTVELWSYEGAFTAVGGPADGLRSTDVGVAEGSSTPVGASLSRTADGTWTVTGPDDSSAGAVNDGLEGGLVDYPEPVGTAPEPPPAGGCDVEPTLISTVQGPGARSDLTGDVVTVNAVLTATTTFDDGYFLQEEAADDDGDDATSEGIYVEGTPPAAVGDQVAVTATVEEAFGLTQLTDVETTEVCEQDVVVPDATTLDLPADDATRERLEGMRVTVAEDFAVTDLFDAWRFGELGLAVGDVLRTPTDVAPVGGGAEQVAAENAARLLVIDDSGRRGLARDTWLGDGSFVQARLGDRVDAVGSPLTGPLSYSFGTWKLLPETLPEIESAGPRPEAPELAGEGPRVATFNVLNLFNGDGDGTGFPTSRGAESYEEYLDQREGIVTAIDGLDADVVGIIEVENDYGDGERSSIAQLVGALDEADDGAVNGSWDYVRPQAADLVDGGLGTDAIAVGILYRPGSAKMLEEPATFDIDEFLREGDGSQAFKNRQPLAASFNLGGRVETVVVNHFKSKGSACTDVYTDPAYDGGGAFDGDPSTDLLGSCNNTRVYAANRLLDWLDTAPTGVGNGKYLVGGDFNAYSEEPPVRVMQDAGYTDLVATKGEDETSYSFDRSVGRLDDLFASPKTVDEVEDATIWQINGREAYVNLYFSYFGDPYDAPGPFASSDHAPVIVSLAPRGGPKSKGFGR